jgi:hypothetical protein
VAQPDQNKPAQQDLFFQEAMLFATTISNREIVFLVIFVFQKNRAALSI